ncbi:hypothetical protein FSP39_011555 [Pinctada imbricata]|uniref:Ubiquinol-cytochrome c chaperone domain-containing protein n=1 Tax=Pinctada imbricata TaxID=66713 RepID=A0AA88XSL9_PINIB|nr:hypothetical protein FSP39_011555 [Pinctada imbricata]
MEVRKDRLYKDEQAVTVVSMATKSPELTKLIESYRSRCISHFVPHRSLQSCCCSQVLNHALYGDRQTIQVPSRTFFGKPKKKEEGPGVEASQIEELKEEAGSVLRMYGVGDRVSKTTLSKSGIQLYFFVSEVVDPEFWFEELKLPDTYFSYFLLMELHVWFLLVRISAQVKGRKTLEDAIIRTMWEDLEAKMNKVPGAIPHKSKSLKQMYNHFSMAMLTYDEGLLGDDKDLAQAIWRNMYNSSDVDPQVLETLVMYIRKQVRHMDMLSDRDFIINGICLLLPLYGDEVPIHVYREIATKVDLKSSTNQISFGIFSKVSSLFGKKKTMSSKEIEDKAGLKNPKLPK